MIRETVSKQRSDSNRLSTPKHVKQIFNPNGRSLSSTTERLSQTIPVDGENRQSGNWATIIANLNAKKSDKQEQPKQTSPQKQTLEDLDEISPLTVQVEKMLGGDQPAKAKESKTRNTKSYTVMNNDPALQATIKELSSQIADAKLERI